MNYSWHDLRLIILPNLFGGKVALESLVNVISGKCYQIHMVLWTKVEHSKNICSEKSI